ncbi:ABC transporter substrate-binding protein [Paenirhodobacter sp.]|uniref:ABC transporter substrate-binding protein n=1 Tax=Paenirhodobacter sp. TaxID=1965326 RepID=UPI003B410A0A
MVRAFLLLLALAMPAGAQPVTLTDIAGREVTLPAPARRIVLGQGGHLPALGLLHDDPVSLLVGIKADMTRDPGTWDAWAARFPRLRDLPLVGADADASFSVETAIALEPDLVILSFYTAGLSSWTGSSRIISQLEAAGIPVIVIDFFASPLENTEPSLRLLGRATGAEARAEEVIAFYAAHRARIAEGIAGLSRPEVMIQVHAGGIPCCAIVAKGVFADMAAAAGGTTHAGLLTPATRRISAEGMMASDPDVYIATGGAHVAQTGGVPLGLGVSREQARDGFCALIRREPVIAGLRAVEDGRARAVWHMFNDSPAHIVLLEVLAKTVHPEAFADLAPEATLREFSTRFSALPLEGTFWTDCPMGAP